MSPASVPAKDNKSVSLNLSGEQPVLVHSLWCFRNFNTLLYEVLKDTEAEEMA